jgi:putative membrane-bound dehydrogenase-like protein
MSERRPFARKIWWHAVAWAISAGAAWLPARAAEPVVPRAVEPRHTIELVAADPDIVTPVGCTHDARGRLLVIESHTHFRPANYPGPPHDRIRLVEDADGDGRADRFSTFFEGTRATMALRAAADGWIYVATRAEVFRIRDTDGDDVADARERLAVLETKGDYPHDGLGGLAFDPDGRLLFGLGENLGHPYRLVAADGSSWSGGGEGGAVFRCTVGAPGIGGAAGSRLERVATGFWNPFGLCVDPVGRLFAVDNDPDGRPPCRLIDVAPRGDYGYQFRYGRGGRHPLQAWDGELPGTLPMAAGTGEAPCSVVLFDGALWVTSWGANRIEAFLPAPRGAGAAAAGTVIIQGGPDFRPVDASVGPDGSLIVTDWVDRSYELHRRGRIWRIKVAAGKPRDTADWPPLSPAELRARRLAGCDAQGHADAAPVAAADLVAALGDDDPFLRQSAVAGLAAAPAEELPPLAAIENPRGRLGCLMAHRWRAEAASCGRAAQGEPLRPAIDDAARDEILRASLADADEGVRLYAVRWIADGRLKQFRGDLEALLAARQASPRLVAGTVAAIAWLDGQGFDGDATRQRLSAIWQDDGRPGAVRTAALTLMNPAAKLDSIEPLRRLAVARPDAEFDPLARAAVRLLALRPAGDVRPSLEAIAADPVLPAERRADAVAGIVRHDAATPLLADLARDADATVARAAASLSVAALPTADGARPAAADTAAWLTRLEGPGDAAAGWRLFFAGRRARCSECHSLGGRGGTIGPELSGIVARVGRARVLESLLQPDKEIGPAFQAYSVGLADGRAVTGLSLGLTDGDRRERFVAADGRETVVDVASIESRVPLAASIMPAGLEQGLSDDDLRDLLTLLAE